MNHPTHGNESLTAPIPPTNTSKCHSKLRQGILSEDISPHGKTIIKWKRPTMKKFFPTINLFSQFFTAFLN